MRHMEKWCMQVTSKLRAAEQRPCLQLHVYVYLNLKSLYTVKGIYNYCTLLRSEMFHTSRALSNWILLQV